MQGQKQAEVERESKKRREQEEVERENDRKLKEATERAQAQKRAEAEEHKRRRYGIRLHTCLWLLFCRGTIDPSFFSVVFDLFCYLLLPLTIWLDIIVMIESKRRSNAKMTESWKKRWKGRRLRSERRQTSIRGVRIACNESWKRSYLVLARLVLCVVWCCLLFSANYASLGLSRLLVPCLLLFCVSNAVYSTKCSSTFCFFPHLYHSMGGV